MPRSSRTLAGLALCVLTASLGTSAANVALPVFIAQFDGTYAQAQWVALAYLVAMTAGSVVTGRLGDVLGRGRVLLAGIAVFTAAAAACALAPSLVLLIAGRAVQGLGAAAMLALAPAMAKEAAGPARTGTAMGMLGTTTAIGTAAGPALGGVLIDLAGWPALFAAMVLPAIAAALLVRPPLRARAQAWRARAKTGATAPAGRMRRRRMLATGMVLNLVVGAVMMTTLVAGPFLLGGALGLAPGGIGLAMAAGPIVSVCTGVLAGRLVDLLGAERMTAAGLAAMTVGAAALALLPSAWGLPGYLTGTVLLAPGYQLFLAANSTGVLAAVPPDRRGTASGALALARNVGLVLGAAGLASVFAAASGGDATAATPAELLAGLRATFLPAGAALGLAAVLARTVTPSARTPHPGRR